MNQRRNADECRMRDSSVPRSDRCQLFISHFSIHSNFNSLICALASMLLPHLLSRRRHASRGGRLSGRDHEPFRPALRARGQQRVARRAPSRRGSIALYVISDYPAARFHDGANGARGERAWPRVGPGDARRLGELLRPAGRVSPIAAGRGAAGHDARPRRPPQLCPALPGPKGGGAPDPRGLALGPAAGDRRLQRLRRRGPSRRRCSRRASSRVRRRAAATSSSPAATPRRCWSSASAGRAARRPWPPTSPRTGSAAWSIGATGGSSRKWPAGSSSSATGTPSSSAICWFGPGAWDVETKVRLASGRAQQTAGGDLPTLLS